MNIVVPVDVKKEAEEGLELASLYNGGTSTGFNRAKQLSKGKVDIETIRIMRNWFARHFYTSYPGYKKWVKDGAPYKFIEGKKNSYRGAVAWKIWGGSSAYQWINSNFIQSKLNKYYPDKINKLPKLI